MNNGSKFDKEKPDLTDLIEIESNIKKIINNDYCYIDTNIRMDTLYNLHLRSKEFFALESWMLKNYAFIYKKHPVLLKNGFANVLHYGAIKYGWDNWDKLEDASNRYWKAFLRHFNEFLIDKDSLDNESGLLHYYHAYANLHFLILLSEKQTGYNINSDLKGKGNPL